jgi:centromere protein S
MAPTSDAEKEERLKAALWYSVGQTIDSVSLSKDINATPHFIGALSEMLWAQIGSKTCFLPIADTRWHDLENVSHDLESFAKHAGRSTINTSDVLLLARRNEGLEDVLKQEAKSVKARDKEWSRCRATHKNHPQDDTDDKLALSHMTVYDRSALC